MVHHHAYLSRRVAPRLQVKRLFVVSRAMGELPLQLEDASRNDDDLSAADAAAGAVRVNQDVRLNNRVIDLRTPANQGIFRMQHGVCQLFRQFLLSQGFTEIHTPKLVGTASEGGADVFAVEYFGRKAYLAQSPQLYKQMALMADLERVFEVLTTLISHYLTALLSYCLTILLPC
tara:strand:+ start:693 stop:1217 length:525 start_codon:yes stop_codon:yes gene_type:complete